MSLYLFVGQTNFGKRVIKETCEAPENPHQEEEQIPFKENIPEQDKVNSADSAFILLII